MTVPSGVLLEVNDNGWVFAYVRGSDGSERLGNVAPSNYSATYIDGEWIYYATRDGFTATKVSANLGEAPEVVTQFYDHTPIEDSLWMIQNADVLGVVNHPSGVSVIYYDFPAANIIHVMYDRQGVALNISGYELGEGINIPYANTSTGQSWEVVGDKLCGLVAMADGDFYLWGWMAVIHIPLADSGFHASTPMPWLWTPAAGSQAPYQPGELYRVAAKFMEYTPDAAKVVVQLPATAGETMESGYDVGPWLFERSDEAVTAYSPSGKKLYTFSPTMELLTVEPVDFDAWDAAEALYGAPLYRPSEYDVPRPFAFFDGTPPTPERQAFWTRFVKTLEFI